jgi:hypothetical protein
MMSADSFTPQPYGQSYGNDGLVYGLGPANTYWEGGTGSLAAISRAGAFRPQSTVELGRATGWITGTLASAQEKARYEGYLKQIFPQGASFDQKEGLWANAAQYAARVNRDDPNARWSPWDALEAVTRDMKRGGRGGGGGSSSTSRSTSVSLTGADEAGSTLDQALTGLLGRTASDAEKKSFLASLNAAERANPSVSTSRSTTSASGSSTSTSSSVSTSVSAGARAEQFARADKGFAEYQYATTYMDAMLDALSSPVRG